MLTAGSDTAQSGASQAATISEWAEITAATVHPAGPIVAVVGCLVALAGAVLVVVAGANNAGVSAVMETFGPRGGPPATKVIRARS